MEVPDEHPDCGERAPLHLPGCETLLLDFVLRRELGAFRVCDTENLPAPVRRERSLSPVLKLLFEIVSVHWISS